jgi:hypothetical protein
MAEIPTDRTRHDHRHDDTARVVSATAAPALLDRVSWGAIFAGTVIALGTLILLGMMGSAIGFSAIDPGTGSPFDGIGIGAGIWWIVTSIIALGIGGYVAGQLSGITERSAATAHGAAVWGLVTLLTVWLAASAAGSAVNTATGALTGTVQAAGSAVGTAADAATSPNSPVDVTANQIERQAEQAIEEVRERANELDTPEARAEAERIARDATNALSSAAWYAFFASLLALAAAALGAGAGAPRHTYMTGNENVHRDGHDHRT